VRPRIALTLARPTSAQRRDANDRYVDALTHAGGDVVPVYPGDDARTVAFDALCLSGGDDIDPARYGEPVRGSKNIDRERDETEFALLRRALGDDRPVLGICRGFQVLNVVLEGKLIQDLPGHEAGDVDPTLHTGVRATPGSHLAEACGADPLTVNSRHHQAVTDLELSKDLRPTARVGDLIEAVESPKHRWIVGVQWHPERVDEVDEPATRIFTAFVRAASRIAEPAR
jgi:putative glutamine amidotransferase